MDVVSVGPLPVGSLVWQPRPTTWVLTVVCKATFVLQPGEAKLAPEQDALNAEEHWNDEPGRSLRAPSDLAPAKPLCDVLLVGHAFAPGKAPTRSLVARLAVGEIDKAIEITCDHSYLPDGSIHEGPPFTRMPLQYERAAGGPGTWNPVGVSPESRDAEGRRRAPNLRPRISLTATGSSIPVLASFGPLAPSWPSRVERLGRHATSFASESWRARPLPEGLDLRYFNQAPGDQQQQTLRENERIVLEHLHPEHAHLTTTLPGLRPAAFVDRGRGAAQRLVMRADTLWIDTDRGLATLTWRGQVMLERPDEAGRVLVGLESPGRELTFGDLAFGGARHRSSSEIDTPPSSLPPVEPPNPLRATLTPNRAPVRSRTLPFAAPLPSIDRPTERLPPRTHSTPDSALPFHGRPSPSQPPMPLTSTHGGSAPDSALPFHSPPPPSSQPAIPLTSTYGGAAMLQPPVIPPAPSPQAPPPPSTPLAIPLTSTYGGAAMLQPPVMPPASSPQAPPPPAMIPPLAMTRPEAESPWAGRSSATPAGGLLRESIGMAAVAVAAPPPQPAAAESAYAEGAIGASNAAAGVVPAPWTPSRRTPAPILEEEPTPSTPSTPSEPLQLLWFHPAIVARIRRVPHWKSLLDEMQRQEIDHDIDDVDAGKETWEIEDRQAVFEILVRGEREDRRGVEDALRTSIRKDGKMAPPLVLVDGEMELPFDELEALKASVSTATAVTGPGDEALKASVGMAKDFLQTPGLLAAPPVCEGLITRIREAFARERKGLPADYLDVLVERALVTGRHYQKREVFGGACLRTLLSPPGEKAAMVGYVPADLAKKLPMGRRLRVRLLAEAHPAQDPYEEVRGVALRGVALALVGGVEKGA